MVRILSVGCGVLALAVAALAFQVHDAQSRIASLEERAASAPVAPRAAPAVARAADDDDGSNGAAADDAPFGGFGKKRRAERMEAIRDAIADANGGNANGGSGGGDDHVSDLVRGELQKIDDEKSAAREARQLARVAKELDQLQADAKLSTEQRQQIETMMQSELVEMRQLFADARDNDAWGDLRDKMRAVRAKTDENATALLDNDAQKAGYQKMRDDERQRFMNAFGGGRGGNGNGASNGGNGRASDSN